MISGEAVLPFETLFQKNDKRTILAVEAVNRTKIKITKM